MKSLGPTSISSQGNTLKHLVLSKNKLSEVPTRALKHLTELEHLNLNENQIQVLRNEAFAGLSKVTPNQPFVSKSIFESKINQLVFKHFFIGHSFEFISQSHQHDWATCIWWHQKVIFILISFFKDFIFKYSLFSPFYSWHHFSLFCWLWLKLGSLGLFLLIIIYFSLLSTPNIMHDY